ncbi:MAG: hypothetical protein KDC92_11350 [Bacteroidetes bacterium]|nr:hypothetical protein [Bacteroidota bacterium]
MKLTITLFAVILFLTNAAYAQSNLLDSFIASTDSIIRQFETGAVIQFEITKKRKSKVKMNKIVNGAVYQLEYQVKYSKRGKQEKYIIRKQVPMGLREELELVKLNHEINYAKRYLFTAETSTTKLYKEVLVGSKIYFKKSLALMKYKKAAFKYN